MFFPGKLRFSYYIKIEKIQKIQKKYYQNDNKLDYTYI